MINDSSSYGRTNRNSFQFHLNCTNIFYLVVIHTFGHFPPLFRTEILLGGAYRPNIYRPSLGLVRKGRLLARARLVVTY